MRISPSKKTLANESKVNAGLTGRNSSTDKLVVLDTKEFSGKSIELAKHLHLPLLDKTEAAQFPPYVLVYTDQGLVLQQTGIKADGPVIVDFVGGASAYRRSKGGGELIVKAVSGNKNAKPSVLDITAGLGRDSFVLANWGYRVTALERSPVVHCLLEDGLERAEHQGGAQLKLIIDRLKLICADAFDYLSSEAKISPPDVVLIDPMFPPSKKSALVKKEMRAFHYVVGPDKDSDQLFQAAYDVAVHRVVVKRPKKSEYLAGKKPDLSVDGKAIRFDIYTKKAFSKA